jgi:uncharacterized membrane protein HdeD (DUF308 family)
MLAGVAMIVAGTVAIVWTRWLMPHQLQRVREHADETWRAHYDAVRKRSAVKRASAAMVVLGCLLIAIGIFFIFTEQ